ncbi:alpha/beta fold hydrolase [Xanthomonas cerealis]|nr:alpha/beta fold hydrolase [Xanthomonas translucens]
MIPKNKPRRHRAVVLLGLALLCVLYAAWPRVAYFARLHYQIWQAGLSSHTRQVGTVRWSYYEDGKGHTVVLLHGIASTKAVWLSVAPQLTRRYRVVIPDLLGWGQSTALDVAGSPSRATRACYELFGDAAIVVGCRANAHIRPIFPTKSGRLRRLT